MLLERNKEVVRRYLEEIVSKGETGMADSLVHPEVVFTSPYTPEPIRNREGLEQMIRGLHAAFPDFYLREHLLLAEGEYVASRWTAGGTHTGTPFGALPPSGRSFQVTGMSIYHVRDGRIVEGWVNDDTLGMATQLGMARLAA
jgi:steroid delta-isomerase-like uncharacterized protein